MTDGAPLDRLAELRHRLIATRAELVDRLACDKIEGGTLALLAGINAAIEAIDATADPPAEITGDARAILADDGRAIILTLYRAAGAVAAVTLAPLRAVGLAGELIEAVLPKLGVP